MRLFRRYHWLLSIRVSRVKYASCCVGDSVAALAALCRDDSLWLLASRWRLLSADGSKKRSANNSKKRSSDSSKKRWC